MCGRFTLPDEAVVARHIPVDRWTWNWPTARYNVAPTTRIPIIFRAPDGLLELDGARWGMIPHWWKEVEPPAFSFNARSEEAAGKPMWRQNFKSMRCVMPVQGWYEWCATEQIRNASGRLVKQPYYISCLDAEVLPFAGLWSTWTSPNGHTLLSCAILTKDASSSISFIHDRMPAVLQAEDIIFWLDGGTQSSDAAAILSRSREDFTGYRVGTKVNNTRNDFPELLEPIDPPGAL